MAIATTARGTYTNSTAATTSTFSPSGNFAAGSWAALFVSADNASSGGSTNDINTVTDSLGNTWTKQTAAIAIAPYQTLSTTTKPEPGADRGGSEA